ncbi:MAG: KpsF/GutQ family sugar-phosphate isomerase [Bacteroidetes bacterium]|nr:KpsF/GutQ family sugar-phosphate isomerase [Bacteroidota bacterium]
MKSNTEIIKIGKETILSEIENVKSIVNFIDEDFANVVSKIIISNGRVVITGIGKSAIIAQKIVATLNSTGTPSIFMHAADAIHGDLGIIQQNDIVIAISKSGNTPEIKALAPLLKQFGNILVAIVGNIESVLAKSADYILNTTIEKEACPNNLAPTTSTTAQLLMGDALAVALLSCKNFTSTDFSKYHPGGALGKRLYLTAKDIAEQNEKPKVDIEDSIQNVIIEISKKRLGATVVMNNEKIEGIITDGDIRRLIERTTNLEGLKAKDIINSKPKTINSESLAVEAAEVMRENKISQLIVMNNDEYVGLIHIHDLNKEGIV